MAGVVVGCVFVAEGGMGTADDDGMLVPPQATRRVRQHIHVTHTWNELRSRSIVGTGNALTLAPCGYLPPRQDALFGEQISTGGVWLIMFTLQ
jgi:hypothetical protein